GSLQGGSAAHASRAPAGTAGPGRYAAGGWARSSPPQSISEDVSRRVQDVAVAAFLAADCEGMARVDCFVTADGEVLVNELNTIPGFTATSVYAKLFGASGISYPELLARLVDLAIERHERRQGLEF